MNACILYYSRGRSGSIIGRARGDGVSRTNNTTSPTEKRQEAGTGPPMTRRKSTIIPSHSARIYVGDDDSAAVSLLFIGNPPGYTQGAERAPAPNVWAETPTKSPLLGHPPLRPMSTRARDKKSRNGHVSWTPATVLTAPN